MVASQLGGEKWQAKKKKTKEMFLVLSLCENC